MANERHWLPSGPKLPRELIEATRFAQFDADAKQGIGVFETVKAAAKFTLISM